MECAYTEYSVWVSDFTVNTLALLPLFNVFCLAVLIQKIAKSQLAPRAGKVQIWKCSLVCLNGQKRWPNLQFEAHCHGNCAAAHSSKTDQGQRASPSLVYQHNLEGVISHADRSGPDISYIYINRLQIKALTDTRVKMVLIAPTPMVA